MGEAIAEADLPRLVPASGPERRLALTLYALSLVLIAAGLLHLAVFAIDDRPWEGPLSWRKPFSFGVSFGLTLATITWVTSYLRMSWRTGRLLMTVFAVDCFVEVGGITLQAWRDVPSHLNTSTPVNAAIAYTLAVGGGVLVVTLGTFAVLAIRGRTDAEPAMRIALRWGFVLLLVGLASGAAMIARGAVEMRTGDSQRAYEVAGFLKPVHAATLHGVLVLPALAVLLARTRLDELQRVRAVRAAVAAYGVLTVGQLAWVLLD